MPRRKLPNDRQGSTQVLRLAYKTDLNDVKQLSLYITTGLFPDGTVGEIFLKCDLPGSTISGLLDALSITASLALQHGVPLETLVEKWSRLQFHPRGRVQDPAIGSVSSLVDAIARWLAARYPPKPST